MAKHFYRVEFQEGSKPAMFCGSSELGPAEFMAEVSSAAFVRLDDLFYRDSQQRARPWSEWDPRMQNIAFISCKGISSVMLFAGDPMSGPLDGAPLNSALRAE